MLGNRPQPPIIRTDRFRGHRANSDGKEGAPLSVGRTTYPAADQAVARRKMPNISVAYCDFTIGLWGVI